MHIITITDETNADDMNPYTFAGVEALTPGNYRITLGTMASDPGYDDYAFIIHTETRTKTTEEAAILVAFGFLGCGQPATVAA